MNTPAFIRKDKNGTATALFGVAAIQFMVGAFGLFLYSHQMDWLGRIFSASGFLYLVLGIIARKARLPASIIGLTVYASFLAIQASRSMALLAAGLVIKLPVVMLLVVSVKLALNPPMAGERADEAL